MSCLFIYLLKNLPDPSDRSLAASCGGDVRGRAFTASEQTLRILACLAPGAFAAALRLTFSPDQKRQDRLRVELALRSRLPEGVEIVRRLAASGPLAQIYEFSAGNGNHDRELTTWPLPEGLEACCEIVRKEDAWEPDQRLRKANYLLRDPERFPYYYAITPFEAREDNDWSAVDRLLDRFTGPAVVEVIAEPADVYPERRSLYEYLVLLQAVNAYGDELDPETQRSGTAGFSTEVRKARDPMADDVHREVEEVQRRLREPQLRFALRCWAGGADEAKLLAAAVAEAGLGGGKYRLLPANPSQTWWEEMVAASRDLAVSDALQAPEVWDRDLCFASFERLARLATVDELKGLFRLPVGSAAGPPRTSRRRTDPIPMDEAKLAGSILIGDDMELGRPVRRVYPEDLETVFSRPGAGLAEVRLETSLLKKHMFIAGVPGSGKTVAMFNIIAQLAHLPVPIPFLVIEPAKTEYRTFKLFRPHPDPVIKGLARDLRVFTVGSEEISPFRFNPFWYPKGVSLDEHIGALMSCFEAAMPMGGPLQGLLAEAVETVYAERPREAGFPRMRDLLAAARRIVDTKGYEGEVLGNLKAALDVRVGLLCRRSLGRVFDCEVGSPRPEELFQRNVVLEMDSLPPEHACLMSLFVLTALREHVRVTRSSGEPLRHVTFLEEAHNIVGRAGEARASEDAADPKAFAAQYVARMLAEMRALGEGIIVADQLPSAVAPEVIKNTGAKLAHRMVANQDREDLGGTMLLDTAGMEELARLRPGETYFYAEGLYRPRRVQALGAHEYLALEQPVFAPGKAPKMPQPPGRGEILAVLEQDDWFTQAREDRRREDLDDVTRRLDQHEALLDQGREQWAELRQALVRLAGGQSVPDCPALHAQALHLAGQLERAVRDTRETMLQKTEILPSPVPGPDVLERMRELRDRAEGDLLPQTRRCLENLRMEAGMLRQWAQTAEERS